MFWRVFQGPGMPSACPQVFSQRNQIWVPNPEFCSSGFYCWLLPSSCLVVLLLGLIEGRQGGEEDKNCMFLK